MKATILKKDVEKALEADSIGEDICETCVLMQVFKRVGIQVDYCSWNGFKPSGGSDRILSNDLQNLVQAKPYQWRLFIGKEIELPDL